ncbi:K02A2.6-like, partial [Cordylochernes scorpioides]
MEQGNEEDSKKPMESDPDYESGENTTFPKKETTLGRLTTTLHQLSAMTGLSRDVELPRYDGSYEAPSCSTNYDAQADRAQIQYSTRLRKPPNLLQAPLRVTNTRAKGQRPVRTRSAIKGGPDPHLVHSLVSLCFRTSLRRTSDKRFLNLKYNDNNDLEQYFKEKSALANKLNLEKTLLLEALTDGMPDHLKKYLIAARVQEPSEWYKITTQLKLSTNKEEEPQQPSTSTSTPVKKINSNSSKAHQYQPFPRTAAATHHQQEPHKPINQPPYPCKICASHQLPNQIHFHRDCPLKNNNHPKRINPDNIPIAQKPYRTSFYNNAEIQKQITELLKYDIIRPSSSPYSSPALLVNKKSDAPNHPTRLCIDYRKLNQKTVPEHTPIPLIEQIIDRLSQSKIYTILDVKNAYWHIPIDEKDRHKTSFVTQLGCYEWNRLPYGLKNAPSQFERIMKSVFTKHNIHYALNYFDDIIIHSKTYEEHIKHLDDILGIFEQEDIKLNINKCKFLQKEIQFLGYTINSGKYTPNNTNIEAILKLNRPYNIKTLQRFLGTINIYNKFIPHYAQIRAPLNELLLKNAPWLWSAKHEQAFQTLKNSLISQPVLYIYDPSKPCHLFTDASSLGVAGVLKQPDEQGILHPIGYFSRKLHPYEQNYTASEIETLAIINSVQRFHTYLHNIHFTLHTDHLPLKWIKNVKNPQGRLFRWSLILSQYSFDIKHIKGLNNIEADMLSRAPVSFYLTYNELKEHQTTEQISSAKFKIQNGLYIINRRGFKRAYVPQTLRQKLLSKVHTKHGHIGTTQMTKIISPHYYWPHMTRDIANYTKHCETCQFNKSRDNRIVYGPLQQMPIATHPNHIFSLDTLGGLHNYRTTRHSIHMIVDHHSRFLWAFPTKSVSTDSYITCLRNLFQINKPQILITDRNAAFLSRKFKHFLDRNNVKHLLTSSHHPETNAKVERLNSTIINRLRCEYNANLKIPWTKYIPKITESYNETVHTTTGFTPKFLYYGIQPQYIEHCTETHTPIEKARKLAIERTIKSHEHSKQLYDIKHPEPIFKEGDQKTLFDVCNMYVLRTCTRTSTYVFPRDAAERDLASTETFDFSTPNEWPKWRKRFERYLVVSGMKKKEEADKIDLFMYLMGDRADDIFRTFKFGKEEEATKIDSVLKAFDSHFCVRKNIIYERAKFNSRIQEDREPVDEFITSLYKLADSCEFEGLREQLIRDRIVVGVRDKALSERMQLDSELTLEKAVKMVRQQEAVRQQQVDLQRPSTSQKVNQVKFNSKKQSPKQQQQPSRKKEKSAITRSRCIKCGGFTHREGQACRAEGQRCNLCSKTGHFANCCPDKQAKTAEVKAVSELDEEIGFLLEVSAVEDSSNLDDDEGECRRRWTAEIQVNGKQLKFKLDSQADVTCVPLCLFKKIMGQQRLVKSDINLRAAEFSELQTVGMFLSTLRNGNYQIKEKIYVIRRLSEPLLSRRACELLNLARRIEVVATRINPIKEFPEVFEGLGQIGNPYEIKLKPGAKPYAVHTPRRVPIPLMEKLKTRLEELEKAGIIAQVNVATEWCAPTVIAGKPNGDIRLCVDLSRLNEHVQREVHPMPVVEHMLGQLGEARFFSKLDANSGFHQIPLSPDCQHLTTFITPFGRYKYCRMPFGISLAPEYFQKVMSIILQGMDGVMCYLDDILIFASDSKTHDRILRLVLRKLKEAKVTLNKAKCVFGVPRINFLGHILDEDGIRPDPAKIEAVAKMPAPTDVHGVRRFIGMVNHLGRFVENLSEIVAPLNQLLVKGQDFVWDCSQERAFRKLKELLTTQPILAAYDVRKPTMVSSDASSYGLGAVLKQEGKNGIWRPVAYSSRTMTPTEKRYAQIEKEALAITWACERFQDFLLGKRFRIETDHKPLIPLFSTKELSSLTPRLQRFRMRMMRFGFEIVHIPGKELLDADALSRQPLLTTEGGENERQTSAHINAVLSSITDKDEMLTKIFEAQQGDTTLKAVVNYLEKGWPDKKKMSQALLSYWHVKDELGVQNGLLMRSCRLVIPASMKLEILDKLHAGHFGITKTRLRARETVWWPGISEEIAETVRKCSVCIQEAVSKHEPLIPTNFPTRPWQKIGMDLFKFENKWYLVVIDYYSRYPEMVQLDRLTASVVVRSCKSIFARHGVPETVVSDNGTQFGAAREFANFARQYGFTHVTSSPRFPQSNGMAEAGVKIAKLILKKNQDPSLGLLEYRSTPLENGYSPAELLMGRKLRTTLPIAPENLNPKLVDSQALKRKEGRRRKDMKSRYDRRCGATDMEELSEGDTVWIADMRTWGIVKKKASTPRSYMVDTPVGTLRRNRFHLRKGYAVQYPADPSTPTFSGEELVENEKTPVVDYPSNDSEDGQIRTR